MDNDDKHINGCKVPDCGICAVELIVKKQKEQNQAEPKKCPRREADASLCVQNTMFCPLCGGEMEVCNSEYMGEKFIEFICKNSNCGLRATALAEEQLKLIQSQISLIKKSAKAEERKRIFSEYPAECFSNPHGLILEGKRLGKKEVFADLEKRIIEQAGESDDFHIVSITGFYDVRREHLDETADGKGKEEKG